MVWLVSIAVSMLVFGLVLLLLLRVNTPRYHVTTTRVRELLEQVVVGQANANDWAVFIAYQIRDNPELERIRCECVVIDEQEFRSQGEYILTKRGRDRVEALLRGLYANRQLLE